MKEIQLDPGGKGLNVARMVHNLGGTSVGLTFFGGENGKVLRKLLSKEGVKYLYVETRGETRNIFNFIEKKSGKVLRINEKGPEIFKREETQFFSLLSNLKLHSCDIVCISGSLPPALEENTYRHIIEKIKRKTSFVVLDSDGEPLKEGIKARPFLIKPNMYELERVVGEKIRSYRKLKNVCAGLIDSGISLILLTLGEKGALLFSKKEVLYGTPPEVKLKSDVGCGDAFLAGFLYNFSSGLNLKECLKFAVACGTAKATKPGTSMPAKQEVLRILKKVKIGIKS